MDPPPADGGFEHGEPPIRLREALGALGRCVARSFALLARGQLTQPTGRRGDRVVFADGSSARVYRETVVHHAAGDEPVVLIVGFRLRWVRGVGHRVFRAESLLNIPLFAGFPGLVSKLWLEHDQNGLYRGIYQWNRGALAHAYARALWWVLAIVCDRRSIDYVVLRGLSRDDLLERPAIVTGGGPLAGTGWWRPTGVVPRAD